MIHIGINKYKPCSYTIQLDIPIQKATHRAGVKQREKKIQRQLKRQSPNQLLQQQGNSNLNNIDADPSDIQAVVGQSTCLQPISCAYSPNLIRGLRLKEVRFKSTANTERTESQINEVQEDSVEDVEGEQIFLFALIQNKNYRINVICQLQVYENLDIQPQSDKSLNVLSQLEKYDICPAIVWVQEKPKKRK
ncbi:MAG: hypothetical protein EZS28_023546 [Streblomastix strix]|uniref:Uncharacterized protein n=1 Tax=Streblomastix strix TaxID=222440 RepID=A0A5J4VER2_9EUKA|nr:MAG: hypothetical protein EZS28_023546 [Streblomastix strix]